MPRPAWCISPVYGLTFQIEDERPACDDGDPESVPPPRTVRLRYEDGAFVEEEQAAE